MNLFRTFRDLIETELAALGAAGALPAGLETSAVTAEPPRDAAHGDIATNAAMVLAKQARMKPRDIAAALAPRLESHADVAAAEVAGPGFINLRLTDAFWHRHLAGIIRAGAAFGASDIGSGRPVNVEYVSANPTGPLHVGHARGAVVGDVLASLLAQVGYAVTREYYVNDAGAQVDSLAWAAYWQYLRALYPGTKSEVIEFILRRDLRDRDLEYRGDYLIRTGEKLAEKFGRSFVEDRGETSDDDDLTKLVEPKDPNWFELVRSFAIDDMLSMIREDLVALGIRHDVFSSERELVAAGAVDAVMATLDERGLLYTGVLEPPKGMKPDDWEERPQLLFRATGFGDDVDRPIRKSDGSWTYFATDLAYHLDKYERGFPALIDVWGADHGGYVKRVAAGVAALTGGAATLDVKICQLVRLLENGEPAKMSKRSGIFVTLRDLVDEVGRDVVRFIMLTRRNDAPLDFDLVKAREQSRDNPVFYVQYAHARSHSVTNMAREAFAGIDLSDEALASADFRHLTDSDELALIKLIAAWPRIVESAAEAHEPHRLAFYLYDLAAAFHALWSKARGEPGLRFVVAGDRQLTLARLALVRAMAGVVASGLRIMGVEPVDELRA